MKFLWSLNPFKKNREEEAVARALKNCFLFESFSAKDLSCLKGRLHVRKYNVGENVFEQHQPGSGMYVLASGKVALEGSSFFVDRKTNKEKKKTVVWENLEPGDFFGELAIVEDNHVRHFTAKIIEPSLIIGFFKPDFMVLTKQNPSIGVKLALKLAKVASERLKDAAEELEKKRGAK